MNRREIKRNIKDRDPIFTIDRSLLLSDEPPVSSIVWIGMDGSGDLGEILPIMFLPNDHVEELDTIIEESSHGVVNAPTFHDSPEIERVEISVIYDIRPVPIESQIESDDPSVTHDNIRSVAQRWKNEYSEDSVDTELLGDGDPVFDYFCSLPVLSNRFQTVIPFFTEVPDRMTIENSVGELYIPCISIYGSESDGGIKDQKEIDTTITTYIVELL
jgi:hypothetical protein